MDLFNSNKSAAVRGTVLILGGEDSEMPCRVLRVSRRSVRIQVLCPLPADSELQVDRGEDCFVCVVRGVMPRASGYVLDLKVLGSNYRPPGPVSALLDGFIGLLRWFTIEVLGARVRVRRPS
jgi:hypothetical protein